MKNELQIFVGLMGGHGETRQVHRDHLGGQLGGRENVTHERSRHVRDEHVDNGTTATVDNVFGECVLENLGGEKLRVSEKRVE